MNPIQIAVCKYYCKRKQFGDTLYSYFNQSYGEIYETGPRHIRRDSGPLAPAPLPRREAGQSAPVPHPRNNNGIFFQFLGWLLL